MHRGNLLHLLGSKEEDPLGLGEGDTGQGVEVRAKGGGEEMRDSAKGGGEEMRDSAKG